MYALIDTSSATAESYGRILSRHRSLLSLASARLIVGGPSISVVLIDRNNADTDALRAKCTLFGSPCNSGPSTSKL